MKNPTAQPAGLMLFLKFLWTGFLLTTALRADVQLPAIFGDNMVLQQGLSAPVWGKADPGETVTVAIAGQKATTKAGQDGKWRVKLPPLPTNGTPQVLVISGKNKITLSNVLIGEVWIGSGQSNMQHDVRSTENSEKEIAAAQYPSIRLFYVQRTASATPLDDVKGKWVECTPDSVRGFSAVLYYFGRDLHAAIQQPVGLIHASWGGTIIQAWSPWEVLAADQESRMEASLRIQQLDDPAAVAKKLADDTVAYKKAKAEAEAAGKEFRRGKPDPEGPNHQSRPSGLYNGMIHPLVGYGIRGIIWYQGEYNAGNPRQYSILLPNLIKYWRSGWGQENLTALVVQLPNFQGKQTLPSPPHSGWAFFRETQQRALADLPDTGLAVTIDTSADGNLHPPEKQVIGKRLALLALDRAYDKPVVAEGPWFEKMTVSGSSVRLTFNHADGGLRMRDDSGPSGFAIAGEDRKFVWAEAKIEGDTIMLSHPEVRRPVAVRYGWAQNPITSVYNGHDLPLAPFRTDNW